MTERDILEKIAADHDAKADNIFGALARGEISAYCRDYSEADAQANRRAAEIIRHQLECEA